MTFALRPHDPNDLLTLQAPVCFDPHATAPVFEKFLDDVLPDPDVRAWVQRYFGYALVGRPAEEIVVIAYGSGANGKTTLAEIIAGVLGPYVAHADIETFLLSRHGGGGAAPSPDLARLKGVRIVFASEPASGRRMNVSRIKSISGGEPIVARGMYRDPFEFTPQFSLWLNVNDRPMVPGDDDALWRRLRLIPFTVRVPENRRVLDLARKIIATEAPGVLNWLLDGYTLWRREGKLPTVEAIEVATQAYRYESDLIAQWIATACDVGPELRAPAGELFGAFKTWVEREDPTASISQQAFGRDLSKRGYDVAKDRAHNWRIGLAPHRGESR